MSGFKQTRILMLLIFTLIYSFINLFVFYQEKQIKYDMLSNQLYYENAFMIENSELVDWNKIDLSRRTYGLYIEITEHVRVELRDSSKRNPPMLWGKYPSNGKDKQKAVVGRNIYDKLIAEGRSGEGLECLGQRFEIVGVVGADYRSACDDLIVLFNPEMDEAFSMKPMVIDVKNKRDLEGIEKLVMDINPGVRFVKRELTGTARVTRSSYYFRLLYIELIVLIALSLFLTNKLQWESYGKKRKVYFILGFSENGLWMQQIVEMLLTNVMALGISMLIGKAIHIVTRDSLETILQIDSKILFLACSLVFLFVGIEKMNVNKIKMVIYGYRS